MRAAEERPARGVIAGGGNGVTLWPGRGITTVIGFNVPLTDGNTVSAEPGKPVEALISTLSVSSTGPGSR